MAITMVVVVEGGGLMEDGGIVRGSVSEVPHRPVCVALFFWQPLG